MYICIHIYTYCKVSTKVDVVRLLKRNVTVFANADSACPPAPRDATRERGRERERAIYIYIYI